MELETWRGGCGWLTRWSGGSEASLLEPLWLENSHVWGEKRRAQLWHQGGPAALSGMGVHMPGRC